MNFLLNPCTDFVVPIATLQWFLFYRCINWDIKIVEDVGEKKNWRKDAEKKASGHKKTLLLRLPWWFSGKESACHAKKHCFLVLHLLIGKKCILPFLNKNCGWKWQAPPWSSSLDLPVDKMRVSMKQVYLPVRFICIKYKYSLEEQACQLWIISCEFLKMLISSHDVGSIYLSMYLWEVGTEGAKEFKKWYKYRLFWRNSIVA